ncbi:inactive serine/threonine-protein kinase VRK3 [Sarcophilus harrisii]|uniref:inactive serine/threonine-protein kinase VRK3 n=1 Tax=Sarcophilus harrisii TaxID=9305 RepID=UPI00130206C5|nr:inactive serine/threonine-protein kinase VRK3 [Sarcophilus harrisii]
MEPAEGSRTRRSGRTPARAQCRGGAGVARAAPPSEVAATLPERASQLEALPACSRKMAAGLAKGPWGTPERRPICFCPECGEEVKPTFTFCPYCGDPLPHKDDAGSRGSPQALGAAREASRKREAQGQGVQRKRVKGTSPCTSPPTPPPDPRGSLPPPARWERPKVRASPAAATRAAGGKGPGPPAPQPLPSLSQGKEPEAGSAHPPRSPGRPQGTPPPCLPLGVTLLACWIPGGAPIPSPPHGALGNRPLPPSPAFPASDSVLPNRRFSLKLDLKNGRLFHEQNFFQRAAKGKEVDRWKKARSLPFLAIPACITFGLHQDTYRFMVFPGLGRSLQSVLDERPRNMLAELTVFHLLFRLVDALEFIHENEYVHGNISAENIFVNPDTPGQVTLAGYSFVFRYCPGGKHVPCVEKKRDPHQGTLEFISLDLHRGTDPSRRSDLQALGYCLLKWLYGALPWTGQLPDAQAVMGQKERFLYNVAELVRRSCGQRKPSEALKAFLKAVMALQYEEKPDYRMLQTVLAPALEQYHLMPYSPISF